jgi:thioredoxin-dependent peroxiredoxin
MAKKIQKKAAKKPAKKTAKAGKKGARKASAKKAVKKVAKKVAKAAKKVAKKVAKKATKKVAKKASRPAAKKGGSLKSKAKKAVKKMIAPARKAVKKAVRNARSTRKNTDAIGVLSNTVSNMVKDALVTVIDKGSPERSESKSNEKGSGEEEEEEERRPRFTPHQTRLKAGNMAPYFEGTDHSGRKVSLYSLSGKTIILYFYPKDDTDGCTATSCNLRDEYNFLTNYNYAVVGVSADDEKSHMQFAKKYNLPFPLLADTDKTIIKAYDVWGPKEKAGKIADGIVRTTFLIDCYGVIKNVITEVDTVNHARQILAL